LGNSLSFCNIRIRKIETVPHDPAEAVSEKIGFAVNIRHDPLAAQV
jgi:hypothetical protein